MFKNILIVCIGNICRSPMAEGLLKHAFLEANKTECMVSSAGLAAMVGYEADPSSRQLMDRMGIDISGHRARQLHFEMIRGSDLVLVMEINQRNAIIDSHPSTRGKVFRLGEWGGFDVMDPYKKDIATFEQSLALIEKGIDQWMDKL